MHGARLAVDPEAGLAEQTNACGPDLLEARLVVPRGVHLVHGNDDLPNAEHKGEQRVLARHALARDGRLERARRGRHHEQRRVRLRSSSNHVFDKVAVARRVDESHGAPTGGRAQPRARQVDREAARALSREAVHQPRVLEGGLPGRLAFAREARERVLARAGGAAQAQQRPRRRRLARVDVADHDEAQVGRPLAAGRGHGAGRRARHAKIVAPPPVVR